MHRQSVSILLLAVLSLQVVLGGFQGAFAICLGGGHENCADEVVEHCELSCSHEATWPTPVPADEQEHDCDCTDLELAVIKLLSTPREGADATVLPPPLLFVYGTTNTALILPQWLRLREPSIPDPGGGQQLAMVRTTRLIL